MSACEKCWGDAYRRMMMLGGSQTEHYYALLEERKDNPCTPEEQKGESGMNMDKHPSLLEAEK